MLKHKDYDEAMRFFTTDCSGPVSVIIEGNRHPRTLYQSPGQSTIVNLPHFRYAYARRLFNLYSSQGAR